LIDLSDRSPLGTRFPCSESQKAKGKKKMKFRIIAVVLILTLAAWLPALAQQDRGSLPAPSRDSDTTACASCDHKAHHGEDRKHSQDSRSCCHGKSGQANGKSCCQDTDGKQMACCNEHPKGDQAAMNCCRGADRKMCANDAKGSCAGKDGKPCCGKDALACNRKDGKNCCADAAKDCTDCPSHS
jgi:hypothetical protein